MVGGGGGGGGGEGVRGGGSSWCCREGCCVARECGGVEAPPGVGRAPGEGSGDRLELGRVLRGSSCDMIQGIEQALR